MFQNKSLCKQISYKLELHLRENQHVSATNGYGKDSFLVLTEAKTNSAGGGLLCYLGEVKGAGERKREATSNSIHSSVT